MADLTAAQPWRVQSRDGVEQKRWRFSVSGGLPLCRERGTEGACFPPVLAPTVLCGDGHKLLGSSDIASRPTGVRCSHVLPRGRDSGVAESHDNTGMQGDCSQAFVREIFFILTAKPRSYSQVKAVQQRELLP